MPPFVRRTWRDNETLDAWEASNVNEYENRVGTKFDELDTLTPPKSFTGTPADLQWAAYDLASDKFMFKDPFFVDPIDGSWGPVSHLTDSIATIQAATNFAVMGNVVDPALAVGAPRPIATRTAKYPIKFSGHPATSGTYLLASKLKIYAVNGLVFEGSGAHATRFRHGAPGMDAVIEIHGCTDGAFRDFGLDSSGTVNDVVNALNIDSSDTVSKISGSFNKFENIIVTARAINGIAVGATGTSNGQDTYHHRFYNCRISGTQPKPVNFTGTTAVGSPTVTAVSSIVGLVSGRAITGIGIPAGTFIGTPSGSTVTLVDGVGTPVNATAAGTGVGLRQGGWTDTTFYQAAWKFGGTGFGLGNVLHHICYGCNASGYDRGLEINSLGVIWQGGCIQASRTCIKVNSGAAHSPTLVEGMRVEASGRLLEGANVSTDALLTLRNIGFECQYLEADNVAVQHNGAGTFIMDEVHITGTVDVQNRAPLVKIGSSGGAQLADIRSIVISTLDGNPHPANWLSGYGRRDTWTVRNVGTSIVGLNPDDHVQDRPLAGPVSNRDRTAPILTFIATTTNTSDIIVSGSSPATATIRSGSTIIHPNLPAGTTILSQGPGVNDFKVSAPATATGSGTAAITRYKVHASDKVISVSSMDAAGATVQLMAIAAVTQGHTITIKDESLTAATRPIVVDAATAGALIEGAGTYTINVNGGAVTLMSAGASWVIMAVKGAATGVDVQAFTTTGTWTKPSGAQLTDVLLFEPGGGGGSGRRGAATTIRTGGTGGGGGGASLRRYRANLLNATETVTIGAAGTGGAAVTVDDTNGNAGTVGAATHFKSTAFSAVGNGGGAGAGGSTGAGAGGVAGVIDGAAGGVGGASSTTAAGVAATGATSGNPTPAGGGGGGGPITAADASFNGGAGGGHNQTAGGTAGVAPGGAGGTPATAGNDQAGSGGGGGGGGGGTGGNGSFPGGGGGGGGGSLNGTNSGKGGDGGGGLIIVTTW